MLLTSLTFFGFTEAMVKVTEGIIPEPDVFGNFGKCT